MSRRVPVTVKTTQVRELLEFDPRTRLIDVRTSGECAAAHIPGSYNVPLDLVRQRCAELTFRHDDPIVLVCASGARADQARSVLKTAGPGHLSILSGGVTSLRQRAGS